MRKTKTDSFSGNITVARGRFRRMSERALVHLQAKDLNCLAYQIGVHLDVKWKDLAHAEDLAKSLKRERRNTKIHAA
jgi:hypothetical protein